jgi:hypothetical protein
MNKKTIDFVLLGLSVLVVIGIVGYARPLVIAPFDNFKTTNNSVLFAFDKADTIFIDDNIEFTSPTEIQAEDNLIVNLKPGVYYWKIRGLGESKIHTLTIVSEIDLKLRDAGEQYELVNAGNTKLNVDVYNNSVLTGNIILESQESKNASGTFFIGREHNES